MKFLDTQKENRWFSKLLSPAITRVLRSGRYLLGPELDSFEEDFRKFYDFNDVVGVKNCTDALTMVVKYIWKPGMPVILPNFGAYPTAVAVLAAGVNPYDLRFVDVDRTMTMDPHALKRLGLRDGILIPVHLFGNPCDMESIMDFSTTHNHYVIEDCAQATGAPVGMRGHFACWSFYPSKPLGALGDGGAISTSIFDDLEEFRVLRFYGQRNKVGVDVRGGVNTRLDEIQSAALKVKLPFLDKLNGYRRKNVKRFQKIVKGIDWRSGAVYHQFPILFKNEKDRLKAIKIFEEANIPVMIHYPKHVSECPGTKYSGSLREHDKVRYRVNDRILSIPVHAFLTEEELQTIEEALWKIKDLEDVV